MSTSQIPFLLFRPGMPLRALREMGMAVTRIRGLMLAHHQVRVLEGPLSTLARLFAMIPPHRCRRVLGTRPRSRLRPRGHLLPLSKPLRLPLLQENLHMMSEQFVITIMPFFIMYYSLSSPDLPFFPRHVPYRHPSVESYHSIVTYIPSSSY